MIDLAFCESLGGSLKFAKSIKPGQKHACSFGIIGGGESDIRRAMLPKEWRGEPLEGGSQDVETLTLALDIGDISCSPGNLSARRRTINTLYGDYEGVVDQLWGTNERALTRIEQTKTTLAPIRIWVCEHSPLERCCLYCICAMLHETKVPLYLVRVPNEIQKDDCIVSYHNTGELLPEELGTLAKNAILLTDAQRMANMCAWNDLTRENAPLRAIVNGMLMGVPADFYDFSLRANMLEGEFIMARIIGNTLVRMPGVSDRWLFLRINAMIDNGELIEVSPASEDHPYSAMLRRS